MSMLQQRRLWALITARADASPDALLAVDEHDRTLTFGAYRERCERVAAAFAAMGVEAGTTVAWQLPTRLESIVVVGALARLGAVQVPMLPIYREREVRFILRQTEPRVFVTPTTWRGFGYAELAARLVDELGLSTRLVPCDDALPEGDPRMLDDVAEPRVDDDPLRWVFFTSGTTAEPKGAKHTDGRIAAGAAGVAVAYAVTERDRYPIVFPFTHIGGIGMLAIQLLTGCGAIAVEQFDAERTPPLLARHGLTIAAGGTPLALVFLQQQRRHPGTPLFPDVRAVMTGAAPTPPGLHGDLKREIGGIGAIACYGLTEAPFLTVSDVRDTDEQRACTVGRPIGGAVLRIVGSDERECATGEVGEIRARGPQICLGYVDAARDVDAFDSDGWFRTGDLGRLDPEGFLVITGRLKDIIVRKGENISAKEVEDVLYAHPAVADVAVIGLPDDALGERCCAVVVPRDGAASLSLDEVGAFCKAQGMAMQKIPEQLELIGELPRNASGKVLKYQLRERFSST